VYAALAVAGWIGAVALVARTGLEAICTGGILLAVGALAAGHTRHAWTYLPDEHILTFTGPERQLATLRGRVATSPSIRPPAAHWQEPSTMFLLSARRIRSRQGNWIPTRGLVRVVVQQPVQDLHTGIEVALPCWLQRYDPPRNPGQYDPLARARLDRVFVQARVRTADAIQPLGGGGGIFGTLARWIGWVRARSRQRLADAPDLDDPAGGHVTQALILGERSPALSQLNETMRRAGIAHFLSISGLHLAVFLGFVYALCRLLLLSPRRAAIVVLVVLAAYLLLAEPRAPLLRSAVMAAMLAISVIARRPASPANALAAALILLLLLDPLQLLTPGFQLSFVIVAALIGLHRPVKQLLFGRWLALRGLRVYRNPNARARRAWRLVSNGTMDAVALSLTAYLAAAPLAAIHFSLFSPYAVVLSLLLFPLVAAVLIPGYMALLVQAVAPNLAGVLASLAGWVAGGLTAVVAALEHLPGLCVDLYPMGVGWAMVLLGAAAVIVATLRYGRRVHWPIAATAGAVVLAATVWTQLPGAAPAQAQLDVLSVGSGQLAILRLPSGPTVLLDGGASVGRDLLGRVLTPFLLDRRLPWPRIAFVSHGDVDHYSAVEQLARTGRLDTVYLSAHFGRGEQAGQGEAFFLEALAAAGVEIRRLRPGDRVPLDDRTAVEVLWPDARAAAATRRRGNELSLVLRVTCDQQALLLPGDIEEVGLEALAERAEKVRSQILLLPHHGSWDDALPAFVRAVDPEIVLVSRSGRLAATGRAGAFFADLSRGVQMLSTRDVGWIRVRFGLGASRVVATAR
jgi:competence protein ComEC